MYVALIIFVCVLALTLLFGSKPKKAKLDPDLPELFRKALAQSRSTAFLEASLEVLKFYKEPKTSEQLAEAMERRKLLVEIAKKIHDMK